MGRYIKRPRLDPEDEASARFWLKALGLGLGLQIARGVVLLLQGRGYEHLLTAGIMACIVASIAFRPTRR